MTNEKINQEELSTLRLWAKEWILSGLRWSSFKPVEDYSFDQGATASGVSRKARVSKEDGGWYFCVFSYIGLVSGEVQSRVGPLPLEDALSMLNDWIREN